MTVTIKPESRRRVRMAPDLCGLQSAVVYPKTLLQFDAAICCDDRRDVEWTEGGEGLRGGELIDF